MHSAQLSDHPDSIPHIAPAERASIPHIVGDSPSLSLARRHGDRVVLGLPQDVVQRTALLRITTSYQLAAETGAAYILELRGRLQDDSVEELRRAWRPLRDAVAVAGVPIWVVLADVEFVDAAGKALLAEMHRAGTLVG
jgi:hypothetical protein